MAKSLAIRFTSLVALVALALALTPLGHAQSNTEGYVYGVASGAAAGSSVQVVNKDTGLKREGTLDAAGNYRVSGLPPGNYTVALKSPGKEDQVTDDVTVSVGSGTPIRFASTADQTLQLEKFTVKGSSVNPIDLSKVESVTILRSESIVELPVERNTTAVALLAPGTVQGVNAFGNLASFGGSSVAENAYYVNGFNLTNFRNGLGGGSVPFEFYNQFNVMTGGYSAEFGRSTGGVINATTKSGSNTFHAGANVYYEPSSLQDRSPSTYLADGSKYIDNSESKSDSLNANVFASGPIWKNHIFYYGLYNVRDVKSEYANIGTYVKTHNSDPFWAGKLDINITNTQRLEFTAISDQRDNELETFEYDNGSKAIGDSFGVTTQKRGGKDYIYKYTGSFTPDFTISALYGTGEANATDQGAGDNLPFIYDGRSGSLVQLGGATTLQPSILDDKRKQFRVDADYNFAFHGTHHIRAGYDSEDNTSLSIVKYSGPEAGGPYWRYYATSPGKVVNGAVVPDGVTQYTRKRWYQNGGSFEVLSSAYYAYDEYKPNDRLLLSLGLRSDSFNNKNSLGQTFIKLDNQLAPRLGLAYDVEGNGKSKLFANYGRYYLPVASNTNIRLAGGENFYEEYYVLNSVNADGTPVLGNELGTRHVFSDGTIKDPKSIVNQDIKPMYQDEYIIGYQKNVQDAWTVGTRFIYRKMERFIEDLTIDPYLNAYAAAHGITGFHAGGDDYYVLSNPGQPMTVYIDFGDGNGQTKLHLSAADQGYPNAERQYYGVEFFFEKINTAKWSLQGSYTWSHTYGNDEGTVLSDIGQADNGLTELFDHVHLMDGRYGNLNNDRRHVFKLWGRYNISKQFQVAGNVRLQSGTPKIALGFYPDPSDPAYAYGAASMYVNSQLVPRGTPGTTPWDLNLDLAAKYIPDWGRGKLSFGIDIFNALNTSTPSEYVATAEDALNHPFAAYGLPSIYHTPRYFRFSASYLY